MFIRRTSKCYKTKVVNDFDANSHLHDVEIAVYPFLQYFVSLALVAFSIFLIFSVSGGRGSIEGFNNNFWWQYVIALIPFTFGTAIIILSEAETVIISRKNNQIRFLKKFFFCMIGTETQKKFTDLTGLSVIKKGKQMINIMTSQYYIVFSFLTCDSFEVLGSVSHYKALERFEEVRIIFNDEEISHKKVIIRNLINNH